jgi:hypothetical protein
MTGKSNRSGQLREKTAGESLCEKSGEAVPEQ